MAATATEERLAKLHDIIEQNILAFVAARKKKDAAKQQQHAGGRRPPLPVEKTPQTTRINPIDQCSRCNRNRVVDKELAQTSCPHCGETRMFASHIFDEREMVSVRAAAPNAAPPTQQLTRARNASAQFENSFPSTPLSVLESVVQRYRRIHTNDTLRARSATTAHFLRTTETVPPVFRRAAERITQEIKGQTVHVFSPEQLDDILQREAAVVGKKRKESLQRTCLRALRDAKRPCVVAHDHRSQPAAAAVQHQ